MAIRVTLECGHASMLRVRTTPEGYTHDWEVFVRGVDNADISQYIDKVVFNLHETFQKPKRVLKEPPYIVKESGYAGFEIPIDVYFKNKDEPKRIQIQYDLHLQPSGPAINNVIRHNEVFVNPTEEFRKKLLKGGGVAVSHPEDPTEKGDYKMVPPMISKPKLSGTDVKKHRTTDSRSTDEFTDLFGNIMTLPAKVSPDNKRSLNEKSASAKPPIQEKSADRLEKSSKSKHTSPHKEKKREKTADERKDKKDRTSTKEKDRNKEKLKRSQSPVSKDDSTMAKKINTSSSSSSSSTSPTKKHVAGPPVVTPAAQKPPSPKPKDKQPKKITSDKERERDKANFKVPIEEQRVFERKKKKHKDDKIKDRKDRDRDHDKNRETTKIGDKKIPKSDKHEKSEKLEKNTDYKIVKDVDAKLPKCSKDKEKVRGEKSNRMETTDNNRTKDSSQQHGDREKQKHKHKRKDKKEKITDETMEKERHEKSKSSSVKKMDYAATSSSTSSSVNPLSALLAEMPERDSSDSAHSIDDDSSVGKTFSAIPQTVDTERNVPSSVLSADAVKSQSPRTIADPKTEAIVDERSRKEKSKLSRTEDRDCRKRKRKTDGETDLHVVKREKDVGRSGSPSVEPVSSSQSPISIEINSPYVVKDTTTLNNVAENEQVAPDSTNNAFIDNDADNPIIFSDDYVSQLKELQQKIMTLQDNQELQRVVQVIAETGQYEITKKTFDFDLCALDRATVQRLQQFFSAS